MRPCTPSTRRLAGTALAVAALTAGLVPLTVAPASARDATVSTWSDLVAAFGAGGVVTLGADITAPSGGSLRVAGTVRLDLQGNALTVGDGIPDWTAAVWVPVGATFVVADSGAGGLLDVRGGRYGSGIGGSTRTAATGSGTVTVTGGTVRATGGDQTAGIGGGVYGAGGAVTVSGGTVEAHGGYLGAGIGGIGDAGSLTVTRGSVTAIGGEPGGPGFGADGSEYGTGTTGSIDIGPAGSLTVRAGYGARAIGDGYFSRSTAITVTNAGTLTVPAEQTWPIPTGITVTNSGTITGGGAIDVQGSIRNTGTVSDAARGGSLNVTGNDYGLGFDIGAATGTPPTPLTVYAATVAAAGLALPTPVRPGYGFVGWFTAATGGTQVTAGTDLPTLLGGPGPRSTTLHARWTTRPIVTGVAPAEGPTAGGTTITVTGRVLSTTSRVTIDGMSAPFTIVSATKLTAVTPAHVYGTVPVVLTNSAGISASSPAATFTYGATAFAELADAFGRGGTIPLAADLTAPAGSSLTTGSAPVVLDLRGHALTVTAPATSAAAIAVGAGTTLSITDSVGGGVLTARGGARGAGIGGGDLQAGGTIEIRAGRVDATGGDYATGLGGGQGAAGGTVTVSGGTVTATGGVYAAGVGGAGGTTSGTARVTGGSLTAVGGDYGAGIGGGINTPGATVTVTGGDVTARGGFGAAGVGGGYNAAGGAVTVGPGSLTATGGTGGAGLGSGTAVNGPLTGGTLSTGSAGSVTAAGGDGASAVGAGQGSTDLGSVTNGGNLVIPAGATWQIPVGAVVTNSGRIAGDGAVVNAGTIRRSPSGRVSDAAWFGTLRITRNDYLVVFDTSDVPEPGPAPLIVYGTTIAATQQQLPAAPARAGYRFTGWYTAETGGALFGNATSLPRVAGAGPATVELYARWVAIPAVTKVSPNLGPTTGGQTVTLSGTGFTGATAVSFGATKAASYTVVSDTTITAVTPAGTAGVVRVAVTGPGGTSPAATTARYRYR